MAQWADVNTKRLQSSLQAMDLAGQTRQRGVQNVFTGLGMLNDTIQKFGMQNRDIQAQKDRQESQQDFQKGLLGREVQKPTDFGQMQPQGGEYSVPARVKGVAPISQKTSTVFEPGVGTMSQDYLDASKFGRDVTARGKEFESAMEMLGIPREKWDFMKENIFHFGPKEGYGIERESDKPKYADVADYVRQEGSTLGLFGAVAGEPVPDPDDPNRMVYLFNKGDTAAKENVKKLLKESISTMGGTADVLLRGIPGKGMNEKWQNMMEQIDRAVDVIWEQGKIEVASTVDADAVYRERFTKYLDAKRKVMSPYLNDVFKNSGKYKSVVEKLKGMGYESASQDLNILKLLASGDNTVDNMLRAFGNKNAPIEKLEIQWRMLKDLQKIMEQEKSGSGEKPGVLPLVDRYRQGAASKSPYGN
jgi:hypothetical protein